MGFISVGYLLLYLINFVNYEIISLQLILVLTELDVRIWENANSLKYFNIANFSTQFLSNWLRICKASWENGRDEVIFSQIFPQRRTINNHTMDMFKTILAAQKRMNVTSKENTASNRL